MTYPARTTTTFYVWQTSYAQTNTDLGGTNEMTETFIVEKRGGTTSNHTEIQFDRNDFYLMAAEAVTPDIGQLYAIWNPDAEDTRSWHKYARCRGFTIAPLPDGRASVSISWSTYYTANPDSVLSEPSVPFQILPGSIEAIAGTREMELYRTNWTTQPSATVDTSAADIGGTAVAFGRRGLPFVVAQTKIRVRLVRDATRAYQSMEECMTYLGNNMVGARNSTAAFGYGIGSLVCLGFNMIKMENEFYEVIAEFMFDFYSDHEQIPTFDAQGEPILNASNNVTDVRWTRITRPTFDFNEFFYDTLTPTVINTNQKAHVLKGFWI